MKHLHFCFITLVLLLGAANCLAQEFVTRAKIEFEKKVNMQRKLSGQNMSQQMRDMLPETDISYYDLLFAGGQTLYKAGRENRPPSVPGRNIIIFNKNDNVLYTDFNSGKVIARKNFFQEDFIIEDSIPPVKWKIGQETRVIAGYECRKAIGRIYDSVYIVAFYAEELVIKGGPEGIQGLPGMILGMAIPRFNTTWFATKVELAKIDESLIVPPSVKGKKLSAEETRARLIKKYEQMGMKKVSKENIDDHLKVGYFLDGY